MTATMMQCGHSANAMSNGKPCCVICIGIHPGADTPADSAPDLSARTSRCDYCRSTRPSKLSLPFFHHRPTMEFDSHYDGCRGWD